MSNERNKKDENTSRGQKTIKNAQIDLRPHKTLYL